MWPPSRQNEIVRAPRQQEDARWSTVIAFVCLVVAKVFTLRGSSRANRRDDAPIEVETLAHDRTEVPPFDANGRRRSRERGPEGLAAALRGEAALALGRTRTPGPTALQRGSRQRPGRIGHARRVPQPLSARTRRDRRRRFPTGGLFRFSRSGSSTISASPVTPPISSRPRSIGPRAAGERRRSSASSVSCGPASASPARCGSRTTPRGRCPIAV